FLFIKLMRLLSVHIIDRMDNRFINCANQVEVYLWTGLLISIEVRYRNTFFLITKCGGERYKQIKKTLVF
ncbi:hypothetical protein DP184_11150, partial [Enterobacter kobei]